MKKPSGYKKQKTEIAELKQVKDLQQQTIESLKRELNAKDLELDAANRANKFKDQIIESKDQTIESKNETIGTQRETIGALKRENAFLTEEKDQDEEKEHSKFCLGLE